MPAWLASGHLLPLCHSAVKYFFPARKGYMKGIVKSNAVPLGLNRSRNPRMCCILFCVFTTKNTSQRCPTERQKLPVCKQQDDSQCRKPMNRSTELRTYLSNKLNSGSLSFQFHFSFSIAATSRKTQVPGPGSGIIACRKATIP